MLPRLFFVSLLIAVSSNSAFSQPSSDKWVRIQSDNKEFSIEVPSTGSYFADKDGFLISKGQTGDRYEMKNMQMVSSFSNGTLVTVESYQAKSGALEEMIESDKKFRESVKVSKFKDGDVLIRELTDTMANGAFLKIRYISSKSSVYILTAGARKGETTEMKRFFDSMKFTPNAAHDAGADSRLLSKLPLTDVRIDLHPARAPKATPTPTPIPAEKPSNEETLVVLIKPRPAYTIDARMHSMQGSILLGATFGPTGLVTKIEVDKTVDGLLRQSIFALMRLRYLPPVAGKGALQPVKKSVEYSFSLY